MATKSKYGYVLKIKPPYEMVKIDGSMYDVGTKQLRKAVKLGLQEAANVARIRPKEFVLVDPRGHAKQPENQEFLAEVPINEILIALAERRDEVPVNDEDTELTNLRNRVPNFVDLVSLVDSEVLQLELARRFAEPAKFLHTLRGELVALRPDGGAFAMTEALSDEELILELGMRGYARPYGTAQLKEIQAEITDLRSQLALANVRDVMNQEPPTDDDVNKARGKSKKSKGD